MTSILDAPRRESFARAAGLHEHLRVLAALANVRVPVGRRTPRQTDSGRVEVIFIPTLIIVLFLQMFGSLLAAARLGGSAMADGQMDGWTDR